MNLVNWNPFRDMEGHSDRNIQLPSDRDITNLDSDVFRTNLNWCP